MKLAESIHPRESFSYPSWAVDLVEDTIEAKERLLDHRLWKLMKAAELDQNTTRNFMVGAWRLVDQFPQYMAMSILKAPYGVTRGQDMARNWLIRNMRVEQNHASYWINWAEASGIPRAEVIRGNIPPGTLAASHWCWKAAEGESLAAGMAATNFALEGVTGEWAAYVTSSIDYEKSFPDAKRAKAMHWLRCHAEYDDVHPWEALDIICHLIGDSPTAAEAENLVNCIVTTYDMMGLSLDSAFES